MKNILKLACLFAACIQTHLFALDIGNQVNFSGGYRNDSVSLKTKFKETESLVTSNHFTVHSIDLGEVGLNFWFSPPKAGEFCCDYDFLQCFYAKGNAYWGWSDKSDFEDIVKTKINDESIATAYATGKQKARTEDFQIGLGYFLIDNGNTSFALTTGYSYDKQRIKTNDGKVLIETVYITDPLYSGLVFKQRWQGPWLGFDLFYTGCNWLVNFGYEYHFAHCHTSYTIPATSPASIFGLSSKSGSNNGYGNVVYLNGHYTFCNNISAGLGVTYKQFYSNHSHVTPVDTTLVEAGFLPGTRARASSDWDSYSILVDLGYAF